MSEIRHDFWEEEIFPLYESINPPMLSTLIQRVENLRKDFSYIINEFYKVIEQNHKSSETAIEQIKKEGMLEDILDITTSTTSDIQQNTGDDVKSINPHILSTLIQKVENLEDLLNIHDEFEKNDTSSPTAIEQIKKEDMLEEVLDITTSTTFDIQQNTGDDVKSINPHILSTLIQKVENLEDLLNIHDKFEKINDTSSPTAIEQIKQEDMLDKVLDKMTRTISDKQQNTVISEKTGYTKAFDIFFDKLKEKTILEKHKK
ncbi:uncharacterized protein LOC114946143 [Nylanderia fulva]|uniref:uncharacterized protein LOC114946143 n=1 Tax=Nylanderia fulva TaxID=613905 RepID=UPI0010FB309A|nr:uncharacterized protein LOC114946143 [Nylanderia fulva]